MNALLQSRGWEEIDGEPCSLDCASQPALLKKWYRSEIILCEPHALVLEAGFMNGTYSGAPLPPDTAAAAWPWRKVSVRVVSVV